MYVKQRPYLKTFLDSVSQMFEIVIFTASQSIYAKQLLDILDPDDRLFSRRAYRESCIFADGSYTKDLTVLGVDLAKIVIIDNSPQVNDLYTTAFDSSRFLIILVVMTWYFNPISYEAMCQFPWDMLCT